VVISGRRSDLPGELLPFWAEEVVRDGRAAERRSLSAQQAAEPQVITARIERNLDKPGSGGGERGIQRAS
jgi:hypothetical protein